MRKQVLIIGHDDGTPFIDVYNQYAAVFDPVVYEVTVAYLTIAEKEATRQQTKAEHIIFCNIPKRKVRGLKLRAIYQLWQLTKTKQFNIVVCHRYKPSYIMLWVAKLMPIPHLICVMHELKTMRATGRQLLMRLLAGHNVTIAGVSNAVRDDLRRDLALPDAQIQTLYNVMDVDAAEQQLLTPAAARTALKLSPSDFLFCNLARLAINKDQATLIQAFAKSKPQMPKAKLVIIGTGNLLSTLQTMVANNPTLAAEDVIFTGFVQHGAHYLRGFDCFVLSSQQEAFGRVIIEAMVARLAIVATRVHGVPEVLGNVGRLVAARDVDAMSAAMLAAYQQTPEQRLAGGKNAYARVQMHYSLPAFKKQFWSLPTFDAQ